MSSYSATQQANFAKNSDPEQGVSICIPRVFNNIGWRRIKQHIIDANLGYVERVDVVHLMCNPDCEDALRLSPGFLLQSQKVQGKRERGARPCCQ